MIIIKDKDEPLICPCCKSPVKHYSKTKRRIINENHETLIVEIDIGKCTVCNKYHNILLCYMIPYKRIILSLVAQILNKKDPPVEYSEQNRIRRWFTRRLGVMGEMVKIVYLRAHNYSLKLYDQLAESIKDYIMLQSIINLLVSNNFWSAVIRNSIK